VSLAVQFIVVVGFSLVAATIFGFAVWAAATTYHKDGYDGRMGWPLWVGIVAGVATFAWLIA